MPPSPATAARSASAAPPAAPAPARWARPRVVDASIGLHLCAGAAAWALPGAELWAAGAIAVNHGVLAGAGLVPRSTLLGPNLRQLPAGAPAAAAPAVALTFDDGPDPEVTPRLLDALDAGGARATFFCIAERARRHPALLREIVARGHSVQNHSDVHRHHFSLLGPRRFRREIGGAQARLADLSGSLPHCFRAPAGLRNPLLDPVLHELDLHLVSWTRRGFDTTDRDVPRVLARLTRRLAPRDILLLHDGHARRTRSGEPVVLAVLPGLLERLRHAGLATVTLAEAVPRRHALAAAAVA